MKVLVGSVAFALTLALVHTTATPAQAQAAPVEDAKLVEARAIIAVMFPPATRDAQMHDLMTQFSRQAADGMARERLGDDPGLRKIFDEFTAGIPDALMPIASRHFPLILEATAQAYTREFSLEELRELRRFAQTPAGSHYLSRSAALVGDPAVATANSNYFSALSAVQQQEVGKLRDKVVAYLEKNPEVARKIASPANK